MTYHEPVDGTAVDETWEHPQPLSECTPDWTHGQHYVQIGLHSVYEVVVHRQWSRVYLLALKGNLLFKKKEKGNPKDEAWQVSYSHKGCD